jgi:signal transduction histidine kinase
LAEHIAGIKQVIDYKFIKKDGSSLWCILSSTPQFDKNGKFDGSITMITDITERKRTEEALRGSEEKYHNLFDSIDEGYCIIEVLFDDNNIPLDYRFLEVNQSFKRQTGLVDAVGRRMRDMAPAHEQHWFDIYGHIAMTGEPVRFQNHAKALGFFYDVYAFRVGKPEQRRVAILFNDITQRKRSEEVLRESEERQRFLLKLSDKLRPISDPVEVHDAVTSMAMDYFKSDRCYYCEIVDDDAVIRRDGSRDDLPSVAGVYPLSNLPIHKTLMESGQPLIVPDVTTTKLVDEELRQVCIQLLVISYLDIPVVKDGKLVGILCIVQSNPREWTQAEAEVATEIAECTWAAVERAKVEETLRESEGKALALVTELEKTVKNKNQFISVLSHELRNPLASIMISLDLMDKLIPEEQRNYKALEIAKRQGKQLTNLVDDLLDVTRISSNKITLKKETVEINNLIEKAVQDFHQQFVDKNVTLEVKLTTPLYIEADASRITQVIGNLLHNAGKFTRSNDLVTVAVSIDTNNNEAVITVQDTGRGIDSNDLKDLFEPFTQVDKTLDRSLGGLGLGLAIVKGMVELHGGRVEAFSEGIGKGAKFTIWLPLPEKHIGLDEGCEKMDAKAIKSLKILMIDDNKDLAEIICELIGLLGYETESAHNGTAGIAKARELQPDVIICDIGLPGMSGYEVAKMIRKDAELEDTFLIALSGYAQSEDMEKSKEAGFDRHLAKPVSLETLKMVLNEVK